MNECFYGEHGSNFTGEHDLTLFILPSNFSFLGVSFLGKKSFGKSFSELSTRMGRFKSLEVDWYLSSLFILFIQNICNCSKDSFESLEVSLDNNFSSLIILFRLNICYYWSIGIFWFSVKVMSGFNCGNITGF